SGRAPRASARGISGRCSSRSSGNRSFGGTCNVPVYHSLGKLPRKRHTVFRKPDGGIYQEQLMGNEGITGPASLLYHVYPPTTIWSAGRVKEIKYCPDPDPTLKHRHFRTAGVKEGGSPTLDRVPVLFNHEVAMLFARPDRSDEHFYRNAQADEV